MSMKLSHPTTYWDADDAYLILSFLDELSDVLWATSGPEVIERQRLEHEQQQAQHADPPDRDERQLSLSLGWPTDPF